MPRPKKQPAKIVKVKAKATPARRGKNPRSVDYSIWNLDTQKQLRGRTFYSDLDVAKDAARVEADRQKARVAVMGSDARRYYLAQPSKRNASSKRTGKKPAKGRKRNPTAEAEAAAQMYHKFHGRPHRRTIELEIEEQHPADVADCGKLLAIDIQLPGTRGVTTLEHKGNTRVVTTPEGGQLYFIGGDQSLDLEALDLADTLPKDHVEIGPVRKIHYLTSKDFHDFEPTHYHHPFGEDNGTKPTLNYDTRNKRIYLTGGTYQVLREGIVN